MLIRTVSLATGIIGAVVGAQLPEIMQQYQQRLGGATDEISSVVERFDLDAASNQMSRMDALAKLHASSDDLVRRRGSDMELNIERLAHLQEQRKHMGGEFLSRAAYFLSHADGELLGATVEDYQPAVPTTYEGIISALVGFAAGWSVVRLIAWPYRRWREMRTRNTLRRT